MGFLDCFFDVFPFGLGFVGGGPGVVIVDHCLEGDYGSTRVQIVLAGRCPRLT